MTQRLTRCIIYIELSFIYVLRHESYIYSNTPIFKTLYVDNNKFIFNFIMYYVFNDKNKHKK